jgi:hypothetical protein
LLSLVPFSQVGGRVDEPGVTTTRHTRVVGFAFGGEEPHRVVCVRVEADDHVGVWIGRPWPGTSTHVVSETARLECVTIEEIAAVLETWPATHGKVADAIQAAAWQGRRALIPARLHAMVWESDES